MAFADEGGGGGGGAERAIQREAARILRHMGKARLERRGDWAFLLADMQNPHGRPVDFAGSKLADAGGHAPSVAVGGAAPACPCRQRRSVSSTA